MAATVAHEIKNPLSAIKSIAQVMREDENPKQRLRPRPKPHRRRN
jgi:signal transduction histidine kinase